MSQDEDAAFTAGFIHYLHNHKERWPRSVKAPALPKGRGMGTIKRVIEVEGEFVVMLEGDELPIANGLANPFEANVVAMLVSTGPYFGKHLTIGFNPVDSESPDDITLDEESFWYKGREYQLGGDLGEPEDALLWYARYGVAEEAKANGKVVDFNRIGEGAMRRWLIRVASKHEVAGLLPEAITEEPESEHDSGDRYHLNLLRDMVRDPQGHHLDRSERDGLLATIDRVGKAAGLEL